jgi:hypothetical protein
MSLSDRERAGAFETEIKPVLAVALTITPSRDDRRTPRRSHYERVT